MRAPRAAMRRCAGERARDGGGSAPACSALRVVYFFTLSTAVCAACSVGLSCDGRACREERHRGTHAPRRRGRPTCPTLVLFPRVHVSDYGGVGICAVQREAVRHGATPRPRHVCSCRRVEARVWRRGCRKHHRWHPNHASGATRRCAHSWRSAGSQVSTFRLPLASSECPSRHHRCWQRPPAPSGALARRGCGVRAGQGASLPPRRAGAAQRARGRPSARGRGAAAGAAAGPEHGGGLRV
jgi:hypothetical protein